MKNTAGRSVIASSPTSGKLSNHDKTSVLKIGPEKTHHRSKILQIDTEDTEKNLEKISSLLLCDLCDLCASMVKSLLLFILLGKSPAPVTFLLRSTAQDGKRVFLFMFWCASEGAPKHSSFPELSRRRTFFPLSLPHRSQLYPKTRPLESRRCLTTKHGRGGLRG